MAAFEITLALYLLVATFALSMTYYEQVNTENSSPVFNALGFLACVFWPVTLLTVVFVAQRSKS